MRFDRLVREGVDNCMYCGECLSKCSYMSLSLEEAAAEMRRLRSGEHTQHVFDHCVSCYSCEAYCPNNGHPYLAILDRHRKRYRKHGLPKHIAYMFYHSEKNFRTDIYRHMGRQDKRLLESWAANERAEAIDEMLYPGCNLLSTPSLADTPVLHGTVIAGSFDQCCGEMYYRLGMIDEAAEIAKKLERIYSEKTIGRMVFVCPACFNMFNNVMPELFGVKFDFDKVFFTDWLLERIKNGSFQVKNPLGQKYFVHDSCHARVMGEDFTGRVRDLILALGGTVTDQESNGNQEGICCGCAAGARSHSVIDVFRVANRAMKDLRKNGNAQPMTYCNGCSLTLTLTGVLLPRAVSMEHLLHLAALAGGYSPPPTMRSLAGPAIRALVQDGIPLILDPRRQYVRPID